MVNGSRYLNGNKKDTPFYRRVGQRVLDMATNLGSGLAVTDSQSGFRAFASSAKEVFRFKQNGLAIESEMLADAAAAGLRIREVEIGVRMMWTAPQRIRLPMAFGYWSRCCTTWSCADR